MHDQKQNRTQPMPMMLTEFLEKHELPCFCEVNIVDPDQSELKNEKEKLYLYRKFENECILAKCYSNVLQNFLLQQRPSFIPSDPNLALETNQSLNLEYLFSDIVSIPIKYHGLFELFSSNSGREDESFDHERDVGLLINRFHKPKIFYVNKEMSAYEISPIFESGEETNTLKRSWLSIPKGSILKLMRVVTIDYEDTGSIISRLKKSFCCNLISIKTDIAFEIKILESVDEILKMNMDSDNLKMKTKKMNSRQTRARLSIADIVTKAFFLPVYGIDGTNQEIDLIPISNTFKDRKIEVNYLHLAKNFAFKNIDQKKIELKLFEETAVKPTKASLNSFNNLSFLQQYQIVENQKYMSIYDLIDYRSNCSIIAAYSFKKKSLVFILQEPVDIGLKRKTLFLPSENVEEFNYFNMNLKDNFLRTAEYHIKFFYRSINKIEVFAFKKKNFEGLRMNEIEKFIVKPNYEQNREIINNSKLDDSIFIFDDESLKRNNLSSSSVSFLKTDKIEKSSETTENFEPKKNQESCEKNEEVLSLKSLDKIRSQFRKTSRAYSLPVNEAILIKHYVNSRIQEND